MASSIPCPCARLLVFRQLHHIPLLQPVEDIAVDGRCHDGGQHRTERYQKECVEYKKFGLEVFHNKQPEGDKQYHHAQSAEEKGDEKSLIGAVG